ncbi:MAG TPA: hypothetical protein VGE52_04370 [Pirellulales bacterium]
MSHEFEQPIRHQDLNASGGSYVANLTLRLAPNLESRQVSFTSAVNDPNALHYTPYVEQGIRAFEETRASVGRPVGYLEITLVHITIHPVDAKEWRFAQAAELAMTQAFAAAEIDL